jgi:excisionase family DNA binding protein
MIGLSRSKLYEFIKTGDIEVIKVGRSTLIPVDSLQQFIDVRRSP